MRAPGGPTAGAGGSAASARRVRPDGPGAASGVGGAGPAAADRVWAVLLLNPDPIEWKELAEAAGVSRVAALEALLGFVNAGLLLHIPAQQRGRFPHGDLWVLAGGLREQQGVSDAVCARLLARLAEDSSGRDGWGESLVRFALDAGVVAPPVPVAPVTGLTVLPRRWLKELVLEQLIASFPAELSGDGHLAASWAWPIGRCDPDRGRRALPGRSGGVHGPGGQEVRRVPTGRVAGRVPRRARERRVR